MSTELEKVEDQTIQARGRGDGRTTGLSLLMWATRGTGLISPWWSKKRDADIRKFWRKVDHLAGALYTFQAKMTTIPLHVEPLDMSIKSHVRLADKFNLRLQEQSEFADGWLAFYAKFIEDLTTQDNGAFGEVIGDGPPDGPIEGMPYGLAHLDSWRCQRTGNPEFPVNYQDTDGKVYKLHRTRVLYSAQMPSAAADMYGVGFCAVSRCFNVAQGILDVLTYKQEKLGSRPHRGIAITQGGLSPEEFSSAIRLAESRMTARQFTRYSQIAVVGSAEAPEADIKLLSLAELPDGFDERESTVMAMAAIALALGMDPRDLWPAMERGVTRAEAMVQHMKQRGKAPGQTLAMTQNMIDYKFLPPSLKLVFDYQDDAEDAQRAEIKAKRSERYERAIVNVGTLDIRTAREEMLSDGEISEEQFLRLELRDGRLEIGLDVLSLFTNPEYTDLLTLPGISDPLDVTEENSESIIEAVKERRIEIWTQMWDEGPRDRVRNEEALAALDALEELCIGEIEVEEELEPGEIGEDGEPIDDITPPDEEDLDDDEEVGAMRKGGLRRLLGRESKEEKLIRLQYEIEQTRIQLANEAKQKKESKMTEILNKIVGLLDKEEPQPIFSPVINIAEQKPPDVHVKVEPQIEIKPQPVNVSLPEQKPPDVHVEPVINVTPEVKVDATLELPEFEETTTQVVRDEEGKIAGSGSVTTRKARDKKL